ncbi:hypothetical protein HKCCE3408_01215 [Rhodobacterales bacterium HKCCE3408]|nr:hypothetical protein [Rhodobacterales bacterium HKCCE3408]
MRWVAFPIALVAAGPAFAQAQSFDEAVRTNVAVAVDVCLRVMTERLVPSETIPPAGFSYRAVDNQATYGGAAQGFTHYYDAPGDTVRIRVIDPDAFRGSCHVETTHLGVDATAAIVESVVAYRRPDAQRQMTGNEAAAMCEIWTIQTGSDAPVAVYMNSGTQGARGCPEDGTARVAMEIPG